MKPAFCYAIAATLFIAVPVAVFGNPVPESFITGVSALLHGEGTAEVRLVRDTGLHSFEVR